VREQRGKVVSIIVGGEGVRSGVVVVVGAVVVVERWWSLGDVVVGM
jgi:hypothetical protein